MKPTVFHPKNWEHSLPRTVQILVAAVLLFGIVSLVPQAGPRLAAQTEVVAVWERIYRQAINDDQRYAIMLKITELKDKAFTPLLVESLDRLYTAQIESGNPSAVRLKIAIARLIAQNLGDLRALDAADLLYGVYRDSKDVFLRADAAIALGKMRSLSYAPILAKDLADINLKPDAANVRNQEILAYGLVQALALMRSPDGFESVFFASAGWYSTASQVKESARTALRTMVDDPSPFLKNVLQREKLFERKYRALEAAQESTAPVASKADIARTALSQGLTDVERDPIKQTEQGRFRLLAIRLLIDTRDNTDTGADLLLQAIDQKLGDDEVLLAYTALGVNAGNRALQILSNKLLFYSERQKAGANTPTDATYVRQIIQSMVYAKNKTLKPALLDAQFSKFSGQITREIEAALQAIPD